MIHTYQDSDWEDKISKEEIVCVQFSASWCSPCRALKPILDKLSESEEYKDKANFYYADIEDGGINTGSVMGVRGVPTTILFRKGQEINRLVGGVPEAKVREFLDESI